MFWQMFYQFDESDKTFLVGFNFFSTLVIDHTKVEDKKFQILLNVHKYSPSKYYHLKESHSYEVTNI